MRVMLTNCGTPGHKGRWGDTDQFSCPYRDPAVDLRLPLDLGNSGTFGGTCPIPSPAAATRLGVTQ